MNSKQHTYALIIILALLSGSYSCTEPWDDHYQADDKRVDMKLWDAISQEPRYSVFVQNMESLSLDTIFEKGMAHTLFIPTNDALNDLLDTVLNKEQALLYHISPTLFEAA